MDGIRVANLKYLSPKFIQHYHNLSLRNLQDTHFISITTTEKLNFCRLFREVQQTLATINPYGLENSRQP